MKLKIDPAHVKRYREIATLLLRHGRGDLVRSTGIDAVLDERDAPRATRRPRRGSPTTSRRWARPS